MEVDVLRALAEPLRWQIVQCLAGEELCVCHLTDDLEVAQPLISHHMRVLREAGLIESERRRYWTYYRLRPEGLAALGAHLTALAERAAEADARPLPTNC